jgi:hypothetical protein
MSDLDRMKKLAGLKETGGYVDYDRFKDRGKGKIDLQKALGQQVPDYMKKGINYVDTRDLEKRQTNPEMDPSLGAGLDPEKGWAKGTADPSLGAGLDPEKGFAKADPRINNELSKSRPMKSEAVGDSAECFYDLQDEYCGEQCPSMPHKILIDELVRYLSGDQLQDFCDDFRRHHMDGMEESKDLNELRKLAGMGTGTDLPPSFDRPTLPRPPGMGTGTDLPGPDGRYPGDKPPLFPGDEPVTINIDDIKDIIEPKPKFPRPDGSDDIDDRINRFKDRRDDLMKKFQFGKIK